MNKIVAFRLAVSFRKELFIILGTISFILLLPMISVLVIANAGVAAIASALVSVNPITNKVEIYNPNGDLVSELSISSTWPVDGVVTLEFGESNYPYQEHHTGIDIADAWGLIGRPVTTFAEGSVIEVVNYDNEFGRYVIVDHGNNIKSEYWHLSRANVIKGQKVVPGNVIGYEGQTGRANGPHVHFQIDVYDIPVNPRSFITGPPLRGVIYGSY